MPKLNVAYIRCSTDKQQVSIEAQEVKIRAQATADDVVIDHVIIDSDESAKSLDRPGMETLLDMIEADQVAAVYCAKLDRVTRSVSDLAILLKRFQKKGVNLVSVSEKLDTGSASGRLVLNIMTSVSSWEREAIGERTSTALQHLKSQGFPVSQPPFGYQSQPRTEEEKKNKVRKQILPHPGEQEVISIITSMRKDRQTYEAIVERLNSAGYRTRADGPWHIPGVRRIFENIGKVAA